MHDARMYTSVIYLPRVARRRLYMLVDPGRLLYIVVHTMPYIRAVSFELLRRVQRSRKSTRTSSVKISHKAVPGVGSHQFAMGNRNGRAV